MQSTRDKEDGPAMAGYVDDDDFRRLFEPFRRELLAHCYRMLGSPHDAEDLVQETYVRAWRSYGRFEGRSSLRTWLYRIATRACLTALEGRRRRPLPTALNDGSTGPDEAFVERPDLPWLEPAPDALLLSGQTDPGAIVTERQRVRLAFIAALQHLPPRQRAVLILRDVLRCRTAETAEILQTTTGSVDSMLRRARARLDRVAPREDETLEPTTEKERALLDRYVKAFQDKDITTMVKLFTSDATWEMPPLTAWFKGPQRIGHHLATTCPARPGELRLIPTKANGQPAFATYLHRGNDAIGYAAMLQVLDLNAAGIRRVTAFLDPRLFAAFGLPKAMPNGLGSAGAAPTTFAASRLAGRSLEAVSRWPIGRQISRQRQQGTQRAGRSGGLPQSSM